MRIRIQWMIVVRKGSATKNTASGENSRNVRNVRQMGRERSVDSVGQHNETCKKGRK